MRKVRISAEEIVADIRAGLDDNSIVRKYKITPEKLQQVFLRLVEAKYLTAKELYERAKLTETQITQAFIEANKIIDEIE